MIGSPTVDQRTRLNDESSRYQISIAQAALFIQLESLLGSPLTAPLCFAPQVELDCSAGRSLRPLVKLLFGDAAREGSGFAEPLIATQLEQLLVSHLFAHQPHNYTSQLAQRAPAPAPRDVRRVLDYIHEHLHEPITLDRLVVIRGVPGRSLHEHFRRFTGKSPLAYVAEQRLARVRRDLMEIGHGDSVTTIATRWGFTVGAAQARHL